MGKIPLRPADFIVHVMGWTEKWGTTSMGTLFLHLFLAMPDTGCYTSKLCQSFILFLVERWDRVSSEVQVLQDSAEPQEVVFCTDPSCISAPPMPLVSPPTATKLFGDRSRVLIQ